MLFKKFGIYFPNVFYCFASDQLNQRVLQNALFKLLRPLVRILLRQGMSFDEFAEVGKRVFVEVADREFTIEGRKQTISRISMLTGVQRKEVSRLRAQIADDNVELDSNYNRGVRIAGGWRRDPDFLDEAGNPAPLPLEGKGSFAELVRRYSGDLPYRAVLDEYRRVGVVRLNAHDQVELANIAGYVPSDSQQAQLNIMGQAGADLLRTLDYNLQDENQQKQLQLSVAYNNVSRENVRAFDVLARREGLKLLKEFDQWLSERDRDANPQLESDDEDRCRVGVGIYFFEEDLTETSS